MEEKQIQSLDYSPLSAPINEEMRKNFKTRFPKRLTLSTQALIIIILIPVLFFYIYGAANGTDGITVIASILLVWSIVAVVYFGLMFGEKHRIRIQAFADKNNLTYIFESFNPAYSGMIFSQGHSRAITEAIVFSNFELGNYVYTTGSGKNRKVHFYGYIKLNLKRPIPHIVLDSKKNNLLGKFSNLPVSFHKSQSFELEGNFSKYFTLYVPETYERDALYVLTPEVMTALIDETASYDLEALGNELYLYRTNHFNLKLQSTYQSVFRQVAALNKEFVDQASQYKDDRVSINIPSVAEKGVKLRTRIKPLTLFVWLLVVGSFIFTFYYINSVALNN